MDQLLGFAIDQLRKELATFINQRAIFGPKKRTKTVQEPHNIFEAYNEGNTAVRLLNLDTHMSLSAISASSISKLG